MDETIDKIFENTQETYEDFVGSLLFLSEENYKKVQNGCHENGCSKESNDSKAENLISADDDAEGIPVEELDAGFSLAPSMDRALQFQETLIPKIGNYVDSDTSDTSSLSDFSDAEDCQINKNVIKHKDLTADKEHVDINSMDYESIDQPSVERTNSSDGFNVTMLNNVNADDPLPGEVCDDRQETFDNANIQITNLGIRTSIKKVVVEEKSEVGEVDSEDSAIASDQIEEFKLDEDFDYDNVELTPKNWHITSNTVYL